MISPKTSSPTVITGTARTPPQGIAAANRCAAECERGVGYAPCINDEAIARAVAQICQGALGKENVIFTDEPAMTSEDCGAYLERIPGAFFWLGVGSGDAPAPLHSPYFSLNPEALCCGVQVHVCCAVNLLNTLNVEAESERGEL